MWSSWSRRFASILLVGLGLAGCGGAPISGQGNDCTTQADCSKTLTCISPTGDTAFQSCEVLCSADSDCPNSQPCESYNNSATLPKYCQVNPG
jgi:hypothetical protein